MRILIIEDEHRIATSLQKGLTQENYAVDVAFDGTTGLDLAVTENYDLYIIDLMLPEINGLQICQEIRKNKIHSPILILTAKSQVEDKVKGLDNGADDYLTKPFSFEELLARIRALCRRPKEIVSEILTCSNLSLDTKTFEVKRNKENINLSNREFMLLQYLLKNKGKIVSKQQIIDHLWNYEADILPNTIEVYIRNLRQKIDLPFNKEKPLIKTMRGFGYKIE
jgi:DNA-binding response OmpR family regulator